MERYYVNNQAQPNGDHEVHKQGCTWMPADKTDLLLHSHCHSAVNAAKKIYRQSNGCYYCSNPCHTK